MQNCTVFLNIQVLSKAFGGADSLPPSAVATAPASPVAAWQRPNLPGTSPQKVVIVRESHESYIPKMAENSGSGTGTCYKGNSLNSGSQIIYCIWVINDETEDQSLLELELEDSQ